MAPKQVACAWSIPIAQLEGNGRMVMPHHSDTKVWLKAAFKALPDCPFKDKRMWWNKFEPEVTDTMLRFEFRGPGNTRGHLIIVRK